MYFCANRVTLIEKSMLTHTHKNSLNKSFNELKVEKEMKKNVMKMVKTPVKFIVG